MESCEQLEYIPEPKYALSVDGSIVGFLNDHEEGMKRLLERARNIEEERKTARRDKRFYIENSKDGAQIYSMTPGLLWDGPVKCICMLKLIQIECLCKYKIPQPPPLPPLPDDEEYYETESDNDDYDRNYDDDDIPNSEDE